MSDDFEDIMLPEPPGAGLAPDIPLDQAGIDALFGEVDVAVGQRHGLRAVIESDIISHDRLPMLEVMFDRMVRTFATSMRNLTSDAIDVSLEEVTSIRFADFTGRIALPAMIGVFRVEEWQDYGLITLEPTLIYAVVDALLGGRKGGSTGIIDGRAFTSIETGLVARMLRLVIGDMREALEPISETTMTLERIETSPRFAAIAGPSNICSVASFRVDMEGRGGRFNILLPYATIEPVRHLLAQRFMGEKLGRDDLWENHLARELRQTDLTLDAVLGERTMTLDALNHLAIGDNLDLAASPNDPLRLVCGGVELARAHLGQRSNAIAVRLVTSIART